MSDPADPSSPLDGGGPLDVAETPGPQEPAARRRRMALILGGVAAAVLIIAALVWLLSDDEADDDVVAGGTTTTAIDATTTSAATATAEANPTSTMQETTTEAPTTAATTVQLPAEPPLRTDAVSGSGCTPGPGALPDGWWYGTIEPPVGSTIAFDLACYYLGDAAEEEAAKRGDDVNNDYYVVNDSTEVRSVPVATDATASCVSLGSGVTSGYCAPGDVAGDWAVWIRVQGGAIDRILEQYAP